MAENYWSRILNQRIGRRRALAATGTTAAAAAFLAACGGGDEGGGGDVSGLVVKPLDRSKEAKKGGTFLNRNTTDPTTFDIHGPVAPLNATAQNAYSTLLRQKAVHLAPYNALDLGPDIAESWEQSADGLQITMKIRQGVKFHNLPPVNGRAMDIDDIVFTWNRFEDKGILRGLMANKANPDAPVISVTATDSRTISIKLKEPVVYALNYFASYGSFSGNVLIIPKETESSFDIRTNMLGTGPFYLQNYSPAVALTMKRHPEYWDQNFAYVDQINFPIVPEYANFFAQIKAGNIHASADAVRAEDLVTLKRDEPRIQIYERPFTSNIWLRSFGWLPDGKSPFMDERVRQAVSMSWDRDAWIDKEYNVDSFRRDGLPVETRWNSALGAEDWWVTGDWLDPQGKDFGPNAKYYQHDIAEAKKLLAAAGHPNGFDVTSNYVTGGQIGVIPWTEPLDGMVQEIGLKVSVYSINYQNEYIPRFRDGSGQYEGWTIATVAGTIPSRLHPVSALAAEYWPRSGPQFRGFSTSGRNDKAGDPTLTSMIEKARLERDNQRRQALTHDIQRHIGKAMWGLLMPGGSTGFSVAWPAVQNYRVWNGHAPYSHYGLWLDQTKPPFTSA
jgi:peptide/nickel transport system substrate-binding protein